MSVTGRFYPTNTFALASANETERYRRTKAGLHRAADAAPLARRQTIDIRCATPADLDLVAPLFDGYRQFYGCSPDLELARRFLGQRLEADESVVFVATIDGKGVGFVQLYPTFTSIGARRAWILNDLFVAPEARRQGVGRALMDVARAFAEETGAAWLELATAKDNARAQALYRSCGYKKDEVFDRFKLTLK